METDDKQTEALEDSVVGGFTVVPDKTVLRKKKALDVTPLWWRRPETVSPEVDGEDSVALSECSFLSDPMRALLQKQDLERLFSVQSRVIPAVLESYRMPFLRPRDICVCTPTGTGKTLAYLIPVLELLRNRARTAARALLVLPSRDLALQVVTALRPLATELGLRFALVVGAASFEKEQRRLLTVDEFGDARSNVDIIVATPGRLVDHLTNTPGFNLTDLRLLVIDEADLMLAEGSQDWYHTLERSLFDQSAENGGRCRLGNSLEACLNAWANRDETGRPEKSLQKLLFSATLTYNPELQKSFNLWDPRFFSSSVEYRPQSAQFLEQKVKIEALEEPNTKFSRPVGLKEFYVRIQPKHKPLFLSHLVLNREVKHVLVFVNSRPSAARLAQLLAAMPGLRTGQVSGSLAVQKRERLLRQFAAGELQLLVCTDALARGMDITGVRCIVSYDAPRTTKDYLHRVGRTARAGTTGEAYTLLQKSQVLPFLRDLRNVGWRSVRQLPFHRSHIRHLLKDYGTALRSLESAVKDSKASTSVLSQLRRQREEREPNAVVN